ncbi:MAG: hypothetical protein ACOX62_01050 [Christensenellales bacterium]|jgi:hypothetical protein
MIRKLFAVALAALICLTGLVGLAEESAKEETIAQLVHLMEEYFESEGYRYDFDENTFNLEFNLKGSLPSCSVVVNVYYDSIEVISTPEVRALESNKEKTALLLAMLNYDIFYAQFGMKLQNGAFYSRGVQLVERTLPGLEEIDVLFHMTLNYIEKYGDQLVQVALAGADPYEVYERMRSE